MFDRGKVTRSTHPPALAEAANTLSRQMHRHLSRLGALIGNKAEALDRQFAARLPRSDKTVSGYDANQRLALKAITAGSAIRFWLKDGNLNGFFEQVAYSGRRLAKLNLAPGAIVQALALYDGLFDSVFTKITPAEAANFRWVREQLQFCVMLTLNNAYYEVREAEAKAFYELFRDEVASRSLDDLYGHFLATLKQFCRADGARYLAFDAAKPKALRQWLSEPRCQPAVRMPGADPWTKGFSWIWSMPLVREGELNGALQFAFVKPYQWLPREQELLAAAAERCVEAAAKARLIEDLRTREEQVRHLAEHMLQVEEMERRRISGELHDEAGQSMLFARLQMEMIEQAMPAELDELRLQVRITRQATEKTIIEIRRLIAALSPATLEQLGLGPALRHLVKRFKQWYPVKVKLQLGNIGGLPHKTEVVVYRLVQECFNNISKHSGATCVNISAQTSDGVLKLTVEDNGVGFNVKQAASKRESFGLQGMRERVELLGGHFEIVSRGAASDLEVSKLREKSDPAMGGSKTAKTPRGARLERGERQGRSTATRSGTKIWIQLPVPREAVAA